jgi:small subunit ribosomal protein S4
MRSMRRRRTTTEYSSQLREKQKIRRMYGILERQFRRYFAEASRREGVTGENLLRMLEMRLDNLVYRLGFAPSLASARQLVRHSHFVVNDKKVTIPSYEVRQGDVVQVKEKSKGLNAIHAALQGVRDVPAWLSLDKAKLSGTVVRPPERADMPSDVQEQLVVELYSK